MNKKNLKTFIKHYSVCFKAIKGLVNGFHFFENDIFCQIFNMNLNKLV